MVVLPPESREDRPEIGPPPQATLLNIRYSRLHALERRDQVLQ